MTAHTSAQESHKISSGIHYASVCTERECFLFQLRALQHFGGTISVFGAGAGSEWKHAEKSSLFPCFI